MTWQQLQAGWTSVGLGEDGAQQMGSSWVPRDLDRVATEAALRGEGAMGKAQAAENLRGDASL